MNKIKILITLLISLLFYTTVAVAQNNKVRIALGEWPPYVSKQLPYGGLIPHLVTRAFNEQGIDVEFDYMSWEQAYKKTLAGEYDATAGWMETPRRLNEMNYSQAVSFSTVGFFHRKETEVSWEELSELSAFKIGAVPGYGLMLDESIQKNMFKVQSFSSDRLALDGLLERDIDLFPLDSYVGRYLLNELPRDVAQKITFDEHALTHSALHLLVSKHNNISVLPVLKAFDKGLDVLIKNGAYQKIISGLSLVNGLSRLQFITEDNAPLNYQTKQGASGLSVAVVIEILKSLGADEKTREVTVYPWARAYSQLVSNDNAVVFAMTKTEEREAKFNWVGPIYRSNLIILARKNEFKSTGLGLAELSGQIICAVRDDVGAQVLESLGHPKDKIYLVPHAKNCALMLPLKRVDLWAFNRDTANWHLTKNGLDPKEFEEILQLKESFRYIAFNKDVSTEIVQAFQNELEYLKISGELDQIITSELLKANQSKLE